MQVYDCGDRRRKDEDWERNLVVDVMEVRKESVEVGKEEGRTLDEIRGGKKCRKKN